MNSGQSAPAAGVSQISARFDEDEEAWVFGELPDGAAGSVIYPLAECISITFDRADQRQFFLLVDSKKGSEGTAARWRIVSQIVGAGALSVLESRDTAVRRIPLDSGLEAVRSRIWRLALLQDLESELSSGDGSRRWWEREHAALMSQLRVIQDGTEGGETSLDFAFDLPAAIKTTLHQSLITRDEADDDHSPPRAIEVLTRLQSVLSEAALGVRASTRCRSLGLLGEAVLSGPARSRLSRWIDPHEQNLSGEGSDSPESEFRIALDPALDHDGIVSDHGARLVWNRDLAELTVNVVKDRGTEETSKELWCRVFDVTAGWPSNLVPAAMAPFVPGESALVSRLKLPIGSRLENLTIEVTADTTRPSRSVSATKFARTIALARRALKAERFSLPTVAAHLWEEAALEWHKRRDWRRCGLALVYAAQNLASHDPTRSLELEGEAKHLLGEDAYDVARARAGQGLPFIAEFDPLNILDPDLTWPDELSSSSDVEVAGMIKRASAPRLVAGVDIGHYGVRVALSDEAGNIVSRLHKAEVAADRDFDTTFDRVASLLRSVLDEHHLSALQLAALGVGIPAPIDPEKGELLGKSFLGVWPQSDVRGAISDFLADEAYLNYQVPVYVGNDANICALGEFRRGRGRAGAYKSMLFVKASAGIGAGIIQDGRVVQGADGSAGEMGHFPILEYSLMDKGRDERDPSLDCPRCQQNGCLEMMASAPALVRYVRELSDDPDDNESLTFRDIIRDALHEPPSSVACKAVKRCGEYLGFALMGAVNLMPPELIVIGGPFSEAGDCFFDAIQDVTDRRAPDLRETTKILPAWNWEWAGVWGAIEFALERSRKPSTIETEPALEGVVEDREGVVLDVDDDSFVARVADVVGGAPDEEVEFGLTEVAATEIDRVVPGAIFSWKIETIQESSGRRVRRSTLSFLPPQGRNPDHQLAGIRTAERAKTAFEND